MDSERRPRPPAGTVADMAGHRISIAHCVTCRLETVPPAGDTILAARDLGIDFGDRMPGELLGA